MITQTTATLNHDQLDTLLCSAFEGGSNYWIHKVTEIYPPENKDAYFHAVCLEGGAVEIMDIDGDKYPLDAKALHRGAEAFVAQAPEQYAAILNGQDDAITGDVFLQCCLYGKTVWG